MLKQIQVSILPPIAFCQKVIASQQNKSHSYSLQFFFSNGFFQCQLQYVEALFSPLRFEEQVGQIHSNNVAVTMLEYLSIGGPRGEQLDSALLQVEANVFDKCFCLFDLLVCIVGDLLKIACFNHSVLSASMSAFRQRLRIYFYCFFIADRYQIGFFCAYFSEWCLTNAKLLYLKTIQYTFYSSHLQSSRANFTTFLSPLGCLFSISPSPNLQKMLSSRLALPFLGDIQGQECTWQGYRL